MCEGVILRIRLKKWKRFKGRGSESDGDTEWRRRREWEWKREKILLEHDEVNVWTPQVDQHNPIRDRVLKRVRVRVYSVAFNGTFGHFKFLLKCTV